MGGISMTVSLEFIEMLRDRANVSYDEAREALEKCDSDLVEALIYLEKKGKIKSPHSEASTKSGFFETLKKLIKAGNETKFIISKNGDTIIDLPLTIVIIVTILMPPLTIIGLIVALFTGHKIRLEKPGCSDMKINKTLDDISSAATKVTDAINKK
jgi:hypothetical protein